MNYPEKISKKLKEKYPFRLELHAHTSPASPCGDIPAREVVRIFHEAGYDGMGITNHFFPRLSKFGSRETFMEMFKKDFCDAANEGERLGMKVYLGAELRFKNEGDNDYLLYGCDFDSLGEIYDRFLEGNLKDFVENYKTDDMLLIQAHPFRDNMVRMDPDDLDAIEAFNMHPGHNSRVAVAADYALKNGKLMTIGSDYHHEGHHGLSATRTSSLPKDTAELVRIIKSGDFVMEIGGRIIV